MTTRRFLSRAAITLSLAAAAASPLGSAATALGQEAAAEAAPAVENSKQQAAGVINGNAVYVHSGAGQNYYPVMKLDKGAKVQVVGIKFDWLKILPPEGAYSYVAKAFVERQGDGKTGRVSRPDLNVRAGSTLSDMKAIVQTKLEQDARVEIIGEKDEYFMIKPPPGAFCYVNKQFVDYVQEEPKAPGNDEVAQGPTPGAPEQAPNVTETPTAPQPPADEQTGTAANEPQQPEGQPPEAPGAVADANKPTPQAPTTAPSTGEGATAGGPTTQPAPPITADAQFDQLEVQFTELAGKPLDDQPVDELLTSYTTLIENPQLPESMRRIAKGRTRQLQAKRDAKAELVAVRKQQEESRQRQMAMDAEREELQEVIKKTEIQMFTAIGTLQTSSYQMGKETLYRLTDPANGRTVVYIRTNEPVGEFLGQFVGVKGELTTDPLLSMKVITPTETKAVSQADLYRTIAAQVVPPSLFPKQASTNNE